MKTNNKNHFALFAALIATLSLIAIPSVLAQNNQALLTVELMPADATNLLATPEIEECVITWTLSTTPNITGQTVYLDDGTTITGYPANLDTSLSIPGLTAGWTYTIRHVSEAGILESAGVWTTCQPLSSLPAPIMDPEQPPDSITGTSNEVTWSLDPTVDPATHLCNVQASTTNFPSPTDFDFESGWQTCTDFETAPGSGVFAHTFNGLSYSTYFYRAQIGEDTTNPPSVKSAFSNVVWQTQAAPHSSGGGGTTTITPVCGNNIVQYGEQCDDGNLVNGDGCSNTCQIEDPDEEPFVRFEIIGAPEFRVPMQTHPNLGLSSEFLVYKPSIDNLDSAQVVLDDFGNGVYEGQIATGTYDFGLNGEAHNTKIIRNVEITPTSDTIVLDFTFADTVELIAGDTVDNNYINGVDMSKLIEQYRMQGPNVLSDLNREGYVNGIDASIIITNYREAGEEF